ncbi:SULTR2, partial [Symbiodinium necroappetens]
LCSSLSPETIAAIVDRIVYASEDLSSAKETIKKLWEAGLAPLGADAAQALWTQYASRRARMEEAGAGSAVHRSPASQSAIRCRASAELSSEALPFADSLPGSPRRQKGAAQEVVERLSRDFLIYGIMPFYEPAEIRARSDVIVKSGLSQKAEDLLLTQIALKYPRILPHHRPRHSCTMASCSSCAAMLLGTVVSQTPHGSETKGLGPVGEQARST